MTLQDIIARHKAPFLDAFGHTLRADQWSALNAIEGCRSGQYGQVEWACTRCRHTQRTPTSCGHRSCNLCQGGAALDWLERQQAKLLPVNYFMATFTLPAALRELGCAHPETLYRVLMASAADTLKTFAKNDRNLHGDIGFAAVLHTHTRKLDYHPHVHIVVPGGAINLARREWHTSKASYLFNGKALAKVFRAKFMQALADAGLRAPATPRSWVVQCQKVGRGKQALAYLSRYLYRGVISNRNIIEDDGEQVSFRYRESKTNALKTRTLPAIEFIRLVLQHTLPKGFRRTRNYGFLHGNARHMLAVVQWCLRVMRPPQAARRTKAARTCPACRSKMHFAHLHRNRPVPQAPG